MELRQSTFGEGTTEAVVARKLKTDHTMRRKAEIAFTEKTGIALAPSLPPLTSTKKEHIGSLSLIQKAKERSSGQYSASRSENTSDTRSRSYREGIQSIEHLRTHASYRNRSPSDPPGAGRSRGATKRYVPREERRERHYSSADGDSASKRRRIDD